MSGALDTPLVVLGEHLDQIGSSIQFIALSSKVKRAIPETVDWNTQAANALEQVRAFLDAGAFPDQLYLNSVYLSSVAAFENFLRLSLSSAINKSAGRARRFGDLTEGVQDAHMQATGRLLARKNRPPAHLKMLDFFDVCRRLGTCLPDSTEFLLNTEALCLLPDILQMDSLFEQLKRFGYSVDWDTLGRVKSVQECVGATGTRETAKELRAYFDEMTRRRHRIAHTGTASDVTAPVLEQHLRVLRSVSSAIGDAL